MSEEPQPELRWAPIPPKPSRKGRVWLIVGLIAAAVLIASVVLFFVLNQDGRPDAGETASPTPSTSSSETPTPSSTPSPDDDPTTPPVTAPPVVDPDLGTFRDQVSVWLESAPTGLDIVSRSSGQEALQVIDTLQEDAQRLSDAQPPSSIEEKWHSGVTAYAEKLAGLRTAVSNGSGVQEAVDAARTAAKNLNSTVGL